MLRSELSDLFKRFGELDRGMLLDDFCQLTPVDQERYNILVEQLKNSGYSVEKVRKLNYEHPK